MKDPANQLAAWQVLAYYDQIAEQNSANVASAKASGKFVRGLQCKVGNYLTVVAQDRLSEVLPLPKITVVPGGPKWLLGLANRYGQLLPVVDAYGMITGKASKSPARSLLVIGQGDTAIGLAIANAGRPVSAICEDSLPENAGKSSVVPGSFQSYISQWAVVGDKWRPILNVEKLQLSVNQWQT